MNQLFFSQSVRWIITYITFLIVLLFCAAIYFYSPQVEETIEVENTFAYPLNDPEFLQHGNIIISYEYVMNDKHLVAIYNNGHDYIMPLFDDREEAIYFMETYFEYLKGLER